MHSTLKNLPEGVSGTLLLDLCLQRIRTVNVRQRAHFIITTDGYSSVTLYLAMELHADKMRVVKKDVFTIASAYGTDDEEAEIQQLQWFINNRLKDWLKPIFNRGFAHVYTELHEDDSVLVSAAALQECFLPGRVVPGDCEYRETTIVTEIPPTYRIEAWEKRQTPKKVRAKINRLSKEDWLKANYPGMKELPRWRFPGMNVCGTAPLAQNGSVQ